MQISSASLLAAQQARTQTPVQPRAAQAKPSESSEFEPLVFAAKAQTPAVNLGAAAPQQAANPMPFARPGSQLDIKI
jgi:hypothetical protein